MISLGMCCHLENMKIYLTEVFVHFLCEYSERSDLNYMKHECFSLTDPLETPLWLFSKEKIQEWMKNVCDASQMADAG